MDKRSQVVLVLGIAITILLLLFNIYLAGIFFILAITVFMSLMIMQDSTFHPIWMQAYQKMPNQLS